VRRAVFSSRDECGGDSLFPALGGRGDHEPSAGHGQRLAVRRSDGEPQPACGRRGIGHRRVGRGRVALHAIDEAGLARDLPGPARVGGLHAHGHAEVLGLVGNGEAHAVVQDAAGSRVEHEAHRALGRGDEVVKTRIARGLGRPALVAPNDVRDVGAARLAHAQILK